MKVLAITLWVLLFFILTNTKFVACVGICRENEQRALETLKKEVDDPLDILSSWVVGKDCCEWEGVVCNNLTRHVIELSISIDWSSDLRYLRINLRYLRINNLEWLTSLSSLENLEMEGVDLSKANEWLQVINMLPSLVDLRLVHCSLHHITPLLDYHNFSSLKSLDLSSNMLSGKLPNVIGNTSLTFLRLDDNKLTGVLPKSVGQFSMLEYFSISNNRLEGVVTESHFSKLTHLRYFDASRNNLTLKVSRNWIPSFQATQIQIGGWNIGPLFPMWLRTQKRISEVDISDCGIQGEVPTWFWNLSSQFYFLNISHNQFIGEVPIISTDEQSVSWRLMNLASNNFSGPIPLISTNVTELDLSNNFFSKGLSNFLCEAKSAFYELMILNLGGNDLSEEIPDCWMNWPELEILILRENNLFGSLPRSMEVLSNLLSLDLRRNKLNGPFPSSLENCTKLHKIDLAENEFIGKLPSWLGMRFPTLIVLILRSNKFDGKLPQELCHLKDIQILDLANNTFVGIIPRCIGNFSAMVKGETEVDVDLNYSFYFGTLIESAMVMTKGNMYQYDTILALFTSMDMSSNNLSGDIPISVTRLAGLRSLNLSKNNLTGRIPNDIGDMKVLESVDLSENQLYGQIPQSFSSLTTLGFLNLSDNNLSGMIPLSTQLQSFDPTSFQGNKLCGLPLLVNCSSDGNIPNHKYEDDESSKDEVDWFYISMAIGFALSFWGVCGSLLFKRSWRHAYFRFIDCSWEMLLAKIPIW